MKPPANRSVLPQPLRSPRAQIVAMGVLGYALGAGSLHAWHSRRTAHAAGPTEARPAGGRRTRLDALQLERLGVDFAPVARGARANAIHVVGVLELNRQHLAEVSSHAAGRIVRLNVQVGQTVTRGQLLAMVESPAIGQAAAEYMMRRAELHTARRHLARQRDLLRQQLTTSREVELADGNVRSAEAAMTAAQTRLRAFGVTSANINPRSGTAPLVSPIDGVVIRREVLLGGWVQPESEAFAIADLSDLWAELDVFESDLGAISVGDPVSIDVEALGLRDLTGEVQLIHSELDRSTRMGRVRIVVPNREGRLRAGLSVAAHIRPRDGTVSLRVPAESVRQRGGRPHVLVRQGNEAVWRPITIGARRGGEVEVTQGLTEGDVIATSGLGLVTGLQ